MKKLLAVVLAVVFVVSSVFIAFAVDKSSLPSAPFPDFLKQFDQGNGNFLFPVSFSPLSGSASTHFSDYEECYNVYNNDIENYYYLFRYNPPVTSSALPYFSVFLIPKTGFRFTTSPAGSYTQYGFRCGSNIKFHQIYFYYDSELGYFVNGRCSKSLDFVFFVPLIYEKIFIFYQMMRYIHLFLIIMFQIFLDLVNLCLVSQVCLSLIIVTIRLFQIIS